MLISKINVVGSNPTVPEYILLRAYSLMVKHTAHNGTIIGSIPIWPRKNNILIFISIY